MNSYKSLPLAVPVRPRKHLARLVAAAVLRSASALLAHLAHRLALAPPVPVEPVHPALEFYADAGAPEGALYLDGELVGWLPGVRRL